MFKVENLSFRYENAKENSIKNISFSVNQGEIVSILGESGSGKSTILRIIAGLEDSVEGQITIDNRVVNSQDVFVDPSKRGVSMVFQDYALFPHMTVKDNVGFGLKKLPRDEREKIIDECLTLVRMNEYKSRYPHELSGGQMQRIAIARAVAVKPRLLLLDEPFSNLDNNLQVSIRRELEEIIRSSGVTCLFVTHDINDAKEISNKIITIENGEIKEMSQNFN
ncbi:MAG: ABC transporter ATP-binding protein [Clostridium sp.]